MKVFYPSYGPKKRLLFLKAIFVQSFILIA